VWIPQNGYIDSEIVGILTVPDAITQVILWEAVSVHVVNIVLVFNRETVTLFETS